MRIRHFDKHGNEIKDLSKVKLPEEIQIELIKVLKGEPKRERNNDGETKRIPKEKARKVGSL